MKIPKAFTSLWSGLVTGAVITAATLMPAMVDAQAQSPVKASAQSELKSQTNQWSDNNTAKPGDAMKYIINYQNVGNAEQKQVVIKASLPANVTVVPDSTRLYSSTNPSGAKPPADTLTSEQGIIIGNYGPGSNAYVTFEANIAAADKLTCGDNQLRVNGSVTPQDVAGTSVSTLTVVKRECAATPPAATKPVPTPTPTTPAPAATPATPAPAAAPAPAANAAALPNTGPAEVLAVFGVASLIGFIGHTLLVKRRLNASR